MSTRAIKVLELLEVLGNNEYRDAEEYVPIYQLEEKLNTTARNIRDIVRSLKNTKYEVESRSGKNGGYRFKPGILKRFFDLSQSDLRALENAKLYDVAEGLEPPDNKRVKKVLDKLTQYDEQEYAFYDPYHSSRLSYDIDYLNYLQMMKSISTIFDIGMTNIRDVTEGMWDEDEIEEVDKYPNYLYEEDLNYMYISYASPKHSFSFNGIYFDELEIEGEIYNKDHNNHVIMMLDLDTLDLRLIELKYVRYSETREMEDRYWNNLSKYIEIVNDKEWNEKSVQKFNRYLEKTFLMVNFSKNISKNDKSMIKGKIKKYCRIMKNAQTNEDIYLINRTKLGLINPFEIKILEDKKNTAVEYDQLLSRYVSLLKLNTVTLDIVNYGMLFDVIDEYSIDDPE